MIDSDVQRLDDDPQYQHTPLLRHLSRDIASAWLHVSFAFFLRFLHDGVLCLWQHMTWT